MSLGSSAEVAADGFCVRFAFAFEFREARVSGIISDLCQSWMLEESFSVFGDGIHFLHWFENSVSSVTKMNIVVKVSLL